MQKQEPEFGEKEPTSVTGGLSKNTFHKKLQQNLNKVITAKQQSNQKLTIQEQYAIRTKDNKEITDAYIKLFQFNGKSGTYCTFNESLLEGQLKKKVEEVKLF